MADIQKLYDQWLEKAVADPDLKTELESIKTDEDGKNDRFYRDLEFGTGGLRGVIGAGTNRMNIYTVKKDTQGLAEYILTSGEKKSVAISYDSRIKSDYFSKGAAEVLAAVHESRPEDDASCSVLDRAPLEENAPRKCAAPACETASNLV